LQHPRHSPPPPRTLPLCARAPPSPPRRGAGPAPAGRTPARLMLFPGRAEADRRPFLDRGAQIPGIAGEKNRHAVMVLGQRRAVPRAEAVELGGFGVEPARRLVW